MTTRLTTANFRWRSKHIASSNTRVPQAPGVYVIGHGSCHYGLEVARCFVYVGETNNLQRRLDEHVPTKEKNPELRDYLSANYGTARCWFARVDADEIKTIQDELIRQLQPRFNVLGVARSQEKVDNE